MIVVMEGSATQADIDHVVAKLTESGFKAHVTVGVEKTIIGAIGDKRNMPIDSLGAAKGVLEIVPISNPFKLVSRESHPSDTIIEVKGVKIGGSNFVMMAGPCSVESREQLFSTAESVKKAGATILRGGAFKPRTSPYSFQGMGEPALKLLKEAGEKYNMPIITELMDADDLDAINEYADIIQLGARNMQNFSLLKKVGKLDKPIMLKRGGGATIEEFLMSAEYIMAEGNRNIMLCERGIRTMETKYTRNTLDLSVVPVVKKLSHLPVIIDPSHGTGKWYLVAPMARAAVAVGADGLMIEVHPNPDCALSDGPQQLTFENFDKLMGEVKQIAEFSGKKLN